MESKLWKNKMLKESAFLVCMFLMTGCGSKEVDYWTSEVFGYILSMPSGDDHDECMAISKEVKSKYNFTVMSKLLPREPENFRVKPRLLTKRKKKHSPLCVPFPFRTRMPIIMSWNTTTTL